MDRQYSQTSSLPSAAYRDYFVSQVGLFDDYIMYQTDQYEYQGLIISHTPGKSNRLYTFYRVSDGAYNYHWEVSYTNTDNIDYMVVRPFYVYSSIADAGVYISVPRSDRAGDLAVMILCVCCIVVFAFRSFFFRGGKKA